MKKVKCPDCNGPVELSRFTLMSVCEFCGMTFTIDQGVVMAAGKMSVMIEYPTPWYVKATGTYKGEQFTISGRIRYRYARGFWDEWFFTFENEKNFWVSEDEGEFTFEKEIKLDDIPSYNQLMPGREFTIQETTISVDERDEAYPESIEGELPRIVKRTDNFNYVDASNAEKTYTLQYFPNSIRVYEGIWVEESDFKLDYPKEEEQEDWFDA